MITARRIRPAAVVVAFALASASVAGFAGPRNGEGDRSFRGHDRNQRQERSNAGDARPAFAPAQAPGPVVSTPPAHFVGQRGGNPWNQAPASRPPVFAPPVTARTPDLANDREGWRNRQPVRPYQAVERHAWNDGDRGTERRNWDRRDWNQLEWGRHNWERHSYYEHGPYPARGYLVDRLPDHCRPVVHYHERFFFDGGVWYQPFGLRFVVVAPPIGIVIPVLPVLYATFWIGSVPYYYANDAYYRWSDVDRGYLVVERPDNLDDGQAEPSGDELYIYPNNNQTEDEQAADRDTCHRWSVDQTGYDPTEPGTYSRGGELAERRANYRRAMQACLSARGYSVT